MQAFAVKLGGNGSVNASLQVQGIPERGDSDWYSVLKLSDLTHTPKLLRLDAAAWAISEGLEIQVAWRNASELQPLLPLAGRGCVEFGKVTLIHALTENPIEEVVIRVLGEAKNPSPCFLLAFDFSPR